MVPMERWLLILMVELKVFRGRFSPCGADGTVLLMVEYLVFTNLTSSSVVLGLILRVPPPSLCTSARQLFTDEYHREEENADDSVSSPWFCFVFQHSLLFKITFAAHPRSPPPIPSPCLNLQRLVAHFNSPQLGATSAELVNSTPRRLSLGLTSATLWLLISSMGEILTMDREGYWKRG